MDKPLFYHQNLPDEKMVYLRVMSYRDSNAIYAVLVSADMKDAGRPFKVITTKPDADVPAFYSAANPEDKELVQILLQAGIARVTTKLAYAGFHTLYLIVFDEDKLMEHDPMGTTDYLERIKKTKESEQNVFA